MDKAFPERVVGAEELEERLRHLLQRSGKAWFVDPASRQQITLVEVEEAKLPLLTGRWVDRNGGEIKIEQTGAEAIATGQNEKATEWWTKGVGKLEGNRITMTHFKGDSQTDVQTGTISADGKTITVFAGWTWNGFEDGKPVSCSGTSDITMTR